MKKTLLALAVMTAAGAVSADDVMSNDIATASISGSLEAKVVSNPVKAGEDRSSTIEYGDAELAISAEAMVYENLTAFGSYNIDDGGASTSIGFKGTWGTLEIGGVDHAWNAGNDSAETFGGIDFSDDAFTDGDNVVAYSNTIGAFSFGVSYDLDVVLNTDGDADTDDVTRTSATVEYSADMFRLGADFSTSSADLTGYGVEGDLIFGAATIGAGYTTITNTDTDASGSALDYFLNYSLSDATSVTLGGQTVMGDVYEGQAIYANVVHALTDIVSTHVEIGSYSATNAADADVYDEGFGLSFGASIDF